MPTALIFTLRPTVTMQISRHLNRSTHAAILRLIAADDATLSAQLHNDARVKPLTVSNVLSFTGRGATVTVSAENTYELRVTLLSAALEALASRWTPVTVRAIELDGTVWQVERITQKTADHRWAGHHSYETIAAPALRNAANGPTRWTLEFASPVTFRQRGLNQPLPSPELVFGSLLDKWNTFAPVTLPHEVRNFAGESLAINNLELRSVAEPTKGGALQIGTVGHCTYTATRHDPFWLGCIEILARFAFYSGVGAGAARGLGRTRLTQTRAHAAGAEPHDHSLSRV